MRLTEALLLRAPTHVPALSSGRTDQWFKPFEFLKDDGSVPDVPALQKLVAQGLLRIEAASQQEFDCLATSGRGRLADARVRDLSHEGRFILAYGAAHTFALAALRWHGYRATRRYAVFRALQYCMGLRVATRRLLDECHASRNDVEYAGRLDVEEGLFAELLATADQLQLIVNSLGPVARAAAAVARDTA